MLLDEDPASLIHECIGNFNIHPDRAALSRISSSLSTLSEARSLRLSEASSVLKKSSRQLNTLNQQHELALSNHNPTEHASCILELDTKKFKVAKEASDLEIEGERLESEVRAAEEQLMDLERRGEDGEEEVVRGKGGMQEDEENVLKLKLYRSLGIDVEADDKGNFHKAIVRNPGKERVRVIDIDSQFSRTAYANYLWETM